MVKELIGKRAIGDWKNPVSIQFEGERVGKYTIIDCQGRFIGSTTYNKVFNYLNHNIKQRMTIDCNDVKDITRIQL